MSTQRGQKPRRQVTMTPAVLTRIIAIVLLIGIVAFLMIHKIKSSSQKKRPGRVFFLCIFNLSPLLWG